MPGGNTMDRYGVVFTVAPSDSCDVHDESCLTFQDPHSHQDSGHSTPDSGHSPIHWRESMDLEKTRNRNRDTREKCLCCLFCFFMVSSASLAALVLLLYTGQVKFQLPGNKPMSNGYPGSSSLNVSYQNVDGMAKTVPRVCTVPGCIETAAAVLTRVDHTVDPCQDFYSYACGGYIRRTPLSWNVTRIRENPDDIEEKYKEFLIDKLSESRRATDSSAISQLKTVFQSCLLRSPAIDTRTKRSVSQMLTTLGGLNLLDSSLDEDFDMTLLISNVTRLYGASPFFKVIVHGRAKLSLINHYSDQLVDDLKALNDDIPSFRLLLPSAFQAKDIRRSQVLGAYHDFLLQYVSRVIDVEIDSRVRRALDEVFVFELELNKLLYDEDSEMTDQPCQNMRFTAIQYLNSNYGGYMIRWDELLKNILGVGNLMQTTFCDIYLKTQLQDLLENTPRYLLKRYIIIHTLVHTELFSLVSHNLQLDVSFSSFPARIIPNNRNDECVDLLLNVLPTMAMCEKNTAKAKAILHSLFSMIHLTLSETLSSLFGIPVRDSGKIVNHTMDEVVREWNQVQSFSEQTLARGHFSQNSFVGNFLKLFELRNARYFDGQKKKLFNSVLATVYELFSGCPDLPGLLGPLSYPSTVPSGIHFGSLGSHLTRQIADKLDIQVLLDHYADDILNDSAVLYLAVRLQCLVTLYNKFDILYNKLTTYKVDGETTKNENWKDHLALKVSYQSWFIDYTRKKRSTIIPGLTENEKQLFFILHAQTMCEKTNDRGIMTYYIKDETQLSPPRKYRVNGVMMNFRPFTDAFRCPPHSPMNPADKCQIF